LASYVVLGKIAEPYGIKGWIKIYPHADDPLDWKNIPVWWVGREGQENWSPCKLVQCKMHGTALVAQFENIADRTAAELIKGLYVGAPKEDLPVLPANQFYWADLIGLRVVNLQGDSLGNVTGLIETGANDVLRVLGVSGSERLLPYVDAVVKSVDLENTLITVDWGLDW
jgi:16S rRNA processing protein RimM